MMGANPRDTPAEHRTPDPRVDPARGPSSTGRPAPPIRGPANHLSPRAPHGKQAPPGVHRRIRGRGRAAGGLRSPPPALRRPVVLRPPAGPFHALLHGDVGAVLV